MWNNLYFKFMNLMQDEEGLGTLEIILIIVVLIGIAILFRDRITGFVENILDRIGDEIDSF